MILSDTTLKSMLACGELGVEPLDPEQKFQRQTTGNRITQDAESSPP